MKNKTEFFTSRAKKITKAKYEKGRPPYETQQELIRLLNGWRSHAQTVIEDNKSLQTVADAQAVIDHANEVYRLLSKTDKCALALAAIYLGATATKAHVRPHEPNATAGRKSKEGGQKGRNARTPKVTKKQAEQALDDAYAENPRKPLYELRKIAAEKLGISANHLRLHITKYNPRK